MANTPLAGAPVLAGDLAAIFPTDVDAWDTYSPTITQSVNVTYTSEYCSFMKIGRLLVVQMSLSITGTGTAANAVAVTFPTGVGSPVGYRIVGHGAIYDASASTWYPGPAYYASATTFNIGASSGNGGALGLTAFTAALASGDKVSAVLTMQMNS